MVFLLGESHSTAEVPCITLDLKTMFKWGGGLARVTYTGVTVSLSEP